MSAHAAKQQKLIALILSRLLPGLEQFYNHQPPKGAASDPCADGSP
jgi:TM2 domain-containing membrane protein YozV